MACQGDWVKIEPEAHSLCNNGCSGTVPTTGHNGNICSIYSKKLRGTQCLSCGNNCGLHSGCTIWTINGTSNWCTSTPCLINCDLNCSKSCGGNIAFGTCKAINPIKSTSVLDDYLSNSLMSFFSIVGSTYKKYPINLKYQINKGKIIIDPSSQAQYKKINSSQSFYTMMCEGKYFCTDVPMSNIIFKRNIPDFSNNINTMTSMASAYLLNNNTVSMRNLNAIWKTRIGFTTNDYNFYKSDFYYDYYTTHNGYAYDCIRIIAQKVFLWHLIYNLSKIYGIRIDFWFYQTFYTCIFESLDGTKPILSSKINIYFNKYHQNYMPSSYDSIIDKWINFINAESDTVKIIICKQASYALSLNELEEFDITKLFKIFSYMTVKFKLLDCFNFNLKTVPNQNPIAKSTCSNKDDGISKGKCEGKGIGESKGKGKVPSKLPIFLMYYNETDIEYVNLLPEFKKLKELYKLKINISYTTKKSKIFENSPAIYYLKSSILSDSVKPYEQYTGILSFDEIKQYLDNKNL